MKKVKNIISAVILVAIFLAPMVVTPMVASAQEGLNMTENLSDVAENIGYQEDVTLVDTIGNIIKIVIGLIGLIALVIFIAGGFMWMTAGGNEEQIEKSKKLMKNAVIGIIIVVVAYAATSFIIDQLVAVQSPSS